MNNLTADKNRRVLIIDDNRSIHEDFRKILASARTTNAALDAAKDALFGSSTKEVRQAEFEVDSAYQGQEGILLVKQALEAGRPYALAFVDVRMPPGLDGVETTQKIWKIDPNIQIVICTAYSDYSWDEMFEKIGNCDGLLILKKPFDNVEALQLAHTLTEKWWLYRQSHQKMEELDAVVAERTRALAGSLSLLNATLESTTDGIVAVDLSGQVLSFNTKFANIWQFPAGLLDRRDAAEMRAHTAGLVKDPAKFLQRMQELQANPEAEVFDVIELKDGRTFERYIFPQRIDGKSVGAVISWRDITERRRTEHGLQEKTAFLEAQVNSSIDGILVVDEQGRKILQNQRMADLLKIPQAIADDKDDEKQLRWVTGMAKDPEQFVAKVAHLYAHPHEISRDEIELKDGTMLDRYSSPVSGPDGKYYGRIWSFHDITERKNTEKILRWQSTALEAAANAIVITDQHGTIQFVNPAFTALTGYTAAEAVGQNPRILKSGEQDDAFFRDLWRTISSGQVWSGVLTNRRKDGSRYAEEMTITPVQTAEGAIVRYIAIKQDVTERKRLEARLFQSQKMETVGKLAGGIAHEFNSILTAIIGQSELLLYDLPAGSPLAEGAAEIRKSAGRAATLTRQLLAYGRKQMLQPEILDLNRVIGGMEGIFHNLLGGEVETQIVPAPGLQAVKADAGQLEQVIMNLAMNARDAMPNGGILTLETANVSFGPESVDRYPELKPGNYVRLAITDTGTGMSAEVKAHLFEPFFSTKGVGQGTGLGLSTCYGIIKQSGGHISVYSEPGRGTTFKIYLPQVESQVKPALRSLDPSELPHGTETILLVEDDPALREMAVTLLKRLGYTVLAAANGVEALSLNHRRDAGQIHLLFTDVVMPHMSGKELADRVHALYPHIKILFTSAYTENAIVHQGVLNKGVLMLQKPFTPSALAQKVREVLDRPGPPGPGDAGEHQVPP